MTLSWEDFRLVKAIADARSLVQAAEALKVNHSTVFRRLAQVEERLGVKLFERHRTGYALTTAGEEMATLSAQMDESIAGFERKLAGQALNPAGELRITTNDTLLAHLLTPVLAGFVRQCPDVRIDVVLANQALNLSRRDADVAIRATDKPPETLVGRRVAGIAWAIYGARSDFPAGGTDADLLSLFGRRWVALGDHLAHLKVARFVRERVGAGQIAYTINTVLGIAEAVENGVGVGALPCFIGDARSGLVRLSGPQPEFATGLWLLTHPDVKNSPRVRVFMDFAARELTRLKPMIEGERPAL